MDSETKICQNCKKDFVIDPEDFNFYEKVKVPPPTFCPLCRAQRRLAHRNERKLFKVKNYFTGQDIFSTYPKEAGIKIITRDEWFSDSWDAIDFGMDIDFSVPFLAQIQELSKKVPMYNFNTMRMVNSPYSFNATGLKNCYLVVNASYDEDCLYGNGIDYCKDCVDNSHAKESERCYECFWIRNCYQCRYSIMSWDSQDLWFCRDCGGCSSCFGSANLRNKSYCIFNKQYTKEEYEKEIQKMELDTVKGLDEARIKARNFWKTQIIRHQQGVRNVNSTGSYVSDCKNVNDSYLARESENMRYCQYMQVPGNKDNYDTTNWGDNTELNYETLECGANSYNNKFCRSCWPSSRNNEYCLQLFSSSDCFGCFGLKKKQYCILNKQYTKGEYEKLVQKIKRHMDDLPYKDSQGLVYKYGEFFPIEFAYFGYNNSIAIQHFPITKEEALEKGYSWVDREQSEYAITKHAGDLPVNIKDTTDNILEEVIECEKCKHAYKIQPNELIFYKKGNLPVPHLCNECRHERRISDRLTLHLYDRVCMCAGVKDKTGVYKNSVSHLHGDSVCGNKIKTGYSPERDDIIYCEKCYQQEVY